MSQIKNLQIYFVRPGWVQRISAMGDVALDRLLRNRAQGMTYLRTSAEVPAWHTNSVIATYARRITVT